VDEVCELSDAVDKFGQFDLVICTEVLEHVVDWGRSIIDLVSLTAPLGHLLITTRSPGFPYHPYPIDTWRYTPAAMTEIFDRLDLAVLTVEADPEAAGVFVLVRKPEYWSGPWSPAILHDVDGVTPMKQPS
jgi:hypothetical protein